MPFSCSECGWVFHELSTKKMQHIEYNKLRYKSELLYPSKTKVCSLIEFNNIKYISNLNGGYQTLIIIQEFITTVIVYEKRL